MGRRTLRVTVDTNVLVRAAVRDDARQAELADHVFRNANTVVVTVSALCEFVWVLQSVYRFTSQEIVVAIEALLAINTVVTNRPAIEAGIEMLKANGDFADAVIAHEGRRLGGDVFASFDKKAVNLLNRHGYDARFPDHNLSM